jgi:hypothetical protein
MWALAYKEIEYVSLTTQQYLDMVFYSSESDSMLLKLTMLMVPPLGPIPRAMTIG